jgi:hypothetical protein
LATSGWTSCTSSPKLVNTYSLIAVEELNIKGKESSPGKKNFKMPFIAMLEYKAGDMVPSWPK